MSHSPNYMRSRLVVSLLTALSIATGAVPIAAQSASVGLSSVRSRWIESEPLPSLAVEQSEHFGWAVAGGDFNGDGYEDLATGIPYDDGPDGTIPDCGIVIVRWGGPQGLATGIADTVLSQFAENSLDPAEPDDRFGSALAVGDFNGDGLPDLAVGVPGETLPNWLDPNSNVPGAGIVSIHYGLPSGIQAAGEHVFGYGEVDPPMGVIDNTLFGFALATGDFDHDGYSDLAAGMPGLDIGAVRVFHGHFGGLNPPVSYRIYQGNEQIADTPEPGDALGYALAAGDFDANSYDDLAIGVPGEDSSAGAVQVVFGSPFGLLFETNGIWRQGETGAGNTEAGDRFGSSLAVGDFDDDGHDDLAIGAPYEWLPGASGEVEEAGEVEVFYGGPAWFDLSKTDRLEQGLLYAPSANQFEDRFGWALAAGDFDRDGYDDLVVGHPFEDLSGPNGGAVTVLSGGASGAGARYRLMTFGLEGVAGNQQAHSDLGRALGVGRFDGDGHDDLAIGVPYFDNLNGIDVGAVLVLQGALFSDGFDGGSSNYWLVP